MVMLKKVYEAFRSAGADEAKAQDAAGELGSIWHRLSRIEFMLYVHTALLLAIIGKLIIGG